MCVPCDHFMCTACKRAQFLASQPVIYPELIQPFSGALQFCMLENIRQILSADANQEDGRPDGSKCPQGHPLMLVPVAGARRILCGECNGRIVKKTYMCADCDYSLCWECRETFSASARSPQARIRKSVKADASGPATMRSALVATSLERWVQRCEQWDEGWSGLKDLLRSDEEALEFRASSSKTLNGECELLGQGRYGMVHMIREPQTGFQRIIKTCLSNPGWDSARLTMEAKILQNLDHPHILRIFSWFEYDEAISIVMDNCAGGELHKTIKAGRQSNQNVPEAWVSAAMRQSLGALAYIHAKGIVHKDIKDANLLLQFTTEVAGKVFGTLPHIIVCDFGLAELCQQGGWFREDRATRVAGTPLTRAPEVMKGVFSFKADIWSMGIVMYEILTGDFPFEAAVDDVEAWNDAFRRGPDWTRFDPKMQGTSGDAQSLCARMLSVKESNRPVATECLQHPWIVRNLRSNLSTYDLEAITQAVLAWHDRTPLQQLLHLWIVAGPSGAACLRKFASLFTQFDVNNAGVLEYDRILEGLQSMNMSSDAAMVSARALDVNKDGVCEYLEFSAACVTALEEKFDEMLCLEWTNLDVKGKGWVSKSQLEPLLESLRPLVSNIDTVILELGDFAGCDGVIDGRDFFKFFGREGGNYEAALPVKKPVRHASKTGLKKEIQSGVLLPSMMKSDGKGASKAKVHPTKLSPKSITASSGDSKESKEHSTASEAFPNGRFPRQPRRPSAELPDSDSENPDHNALVPCTPSRPTFLVSL